MERIGWQVTYMVACGVYNPLKKASVVFESERHVSGIMDYKSACYAFNKIYRKLACRFGFAFEPIETYPVMPHKRCRILDAFNLTLFVWLDRVVVRLCDKCHWYEQAPTSFDMEQHRRLVDRWVEELQKNREGC